jgi:hypothetical protein
VCAYSGERNERAPMAPPPPPPHVATSGTATVLSEELKQSQMFCFSRFINGRLGGGSNVRSLSFANDLADGMVYAKLVSLTRDLGELDPSSGSVNALKPETSLSRRRDNMGRLMDSLRNSNMLPPSCAKPSDATKIISEIVNSNISVTLDFTFHLLLKLQMYRLKNVIQQAPPGDPCFACLHSLIHGESGGRSTAGVRYLNSLGDMQRLLLNWCSDLVKSNGLQVWNFNASMQDGKVLLAMIHALLPEVFPYDPVENAGPNTKFAELKALNLATALGRLESPPLCVVNCVSFSREHGSDALEERSVVLLLSEFLVKACVVAARRFNASLKIQKIMKKFHSTHPPRSKKSKDNKHHKHHHHRSGGVESPNSKDNGDNKHEKQRKRELALYKNRDSSFVRNRRVGSDTAGSDEAWLDAAEGDMTLANQSSDPIQQQQQHHHRHHRREPLPTDALETSMDHSYGDHDDDDVRGGGGGVDGTLAAVTLPHETLLTTVPVAGPLKPMSDPPPHTELPGGTKANSHRNKWSSSDAKGGDQSSRFEAEKQQWLEGLEVSFLKADKNKSGMLSSTIGKQDSLCQVNMCVCVCVFTWMLSHVFDT